MTNEYTERMAALRERARRILEVALEDDEVPDGRIRALVEGILLIEHGWETVKDHPNPERVAPFDLEAKLDEWEEQFDQREEELGIA